MNWINLVSEDGLTKIKELSYQQPQLIFKHSTRCSISIVAKNRLENTTTPTGVDFYYLDLLNYRSVSNEIANSFQVIHQSPQLLVIKNGVSCYHASHNDVALVNLSRFI